VKKGALAAGAALAAAIVAALLLLPRPGAAPRDAAAGAPRYRESPVTRDRVLRGELPPVEQRLPEQPLVVPTPDGIGRYDSDPRPPR
jgi:peptide/nickel transport system substrate-binding protein